MGEDTKADEKEKELAREFTKDMATENDIEKPELTKFGKFCYRHGINPNLIMLKITLFVMYGGTQIWHDMIFMQLNSSSKRFELFARYLFLSLFR